MPWNMVTDPFDSRGLSALVACLSILFLFWGLAYRRMKGHHAAPIALAIAVATAVLAFGMPLRLSLLATLNGMMFGLFPIGWIVIAGLFIYNLSVRTGQFEIIKNSLASITDDRRIQALLIAFSFGAFIEGCAGFGTPVAITAAMLMGLGFPPLQAAGLCLLANTAPVAFGSIGIPILVGAQASGVDPMSLSQMVGRTLPPVSFIIPFYMVTVMSGWRKSLQVWPAAAVAGGSFALAQGLTSNLLGPMLPDIVSSITSIVCLTAFLRVWRPKESWVFPHEAAATGRARLRYTGGQVLRAWAPFIIVSILVAAWGVKPIKEAIDGYTTTKILIPGLHEMVVRDGKPVPAVFNLNLLSSSGTAVFLAGLASIPVMGASLWTALCVLGQTIRTVRWPLVTIAAILGFAYIMNFSGMAIALGNAFALTGVLFPFFAAFLGWLGVFMTGSDTSSNALFGRLQEVTATQIGVDPVVTVSANSTGGVCGKMVSPQSLAVATASVGLVGREGDIFRFTIKHSLILTTVIGVIVYLQAHVFTWMIPVREQVAATAAGAATAAASSTSEGLIYLGVTAGLVLAVAGASIRLGRKGLALSSEHEAD
ncbi:MAG: lactate permease LctP family transporter [Planctomycetota bacterium]|nr:lactate permease LctP family transporter [Planctomycetota bacterium]